MISAMVFVCTVVKGGGGNCHGARNRLMRRFGRIYQLFTSKKFLLLGTVAKNVGIISGLNMTKM